MKWRYTVYRILYRYSIVFRLFLSNWRINWFVETTVIQIKFLIILNIPRLLTAGYIYAEYSCWQNMRFFSNIPRQKIFKPDFKSKIFRSARQWRINYFKNIFRLASEVSQHVGTGSIGFFSNVPMQKIGVFNQQK